MRERGGDFKKVIKSVTYCMYLFNLTQQLVQLKAYIFVREIRNTHILPYFRSTLAVYFLLLQTIRNGRNTQNGFEGWRARIFVPGNEP